MRAMRLRQVHLKNILSFRDAVLTEIGPVNLLIGPNASGKSNFLDALSLLQNAPTGLPTQIARGGGIREWIWKGDDALFAIGKIECIAQIEESDFPLQYLLSIQEADQAFTIHEERLVAQRQVKGSNTPLFDREEGNVILRGSLSGQLLRNGNRISKIATTESVLKAFRDPTEMRELTALGKGFEGIRIYRNFDTSPGPNSGARHGVSTSYPPSDTLAEDGYNLALVLSGMRINGSIKKVESYLTDFSARFGEVNVDPFGGIARILIGEEGLQRPTPAVRLSDGTLKFLCLLAVLCNTESTPGVVCIDEPEAGLHPDAVRLLARAIREASRSTQFIIATHSEALIDEFSDMPEAVVVCESNSQRGTQFQRLSRKKLKAWLKDYSLGELWRKGTIGGNPW
jgi:predicted ATPase